MSDTSTIYGLRTTPVTPNGLRKWATHTGLELIGSREVHPDNPDCRQKLWKFSYRYGLTIRSLQLLVRNGTAPEAAFWQHIEELYKAYSWNGLKEVLGGGSVR